MPVLGLGLGLQRKSAMGGINPIARAFRARVLADGGTFEAMPCFLATLAELQAITIETSIVNIFQARVLADSGTFEAKTCMETIITDLQNI